VLPTILSRCQRFDLRRIPAALISKHLTYIADREKVKIDPAALYAIARGAEGGMRDAESTLDQLISFCGESIEEADVLSMFGLTAQSQLIDLARAILSGEIEAALRQLNDLAGKGKDLGRLVSDLLNHFRNLLIFRVSGGDLAMLEVSEAESGVLSEQSKMASPEGLTRILEVFGEAEMRLRDAASKKILIEVALLKAIEARTALSIDAVLKQLQALRSGTAASPASQPAAPKAAVVAASRSDRQNPAAEPAPLPVAQPPAMAARPATHSPAAPQENPGGGNLAQLWSQLLEAVGRASPFTRTYLLGAHPVSLAKTSLTIGFDASLEDQIGLVDTPTVHALLRTKLAELGHPGLQAKFVVAEKPGAVEAISPAPEAPPEPANAVKPAATPHPVERPTQKAAAQPKTAPVPFNKDDFKKDPLIQKALEVFKGQIVEVRSNN
jgi:DNA polymerase-3 subunit gamma/tau